MTRQGIALSMLVLGYGLAVAVIFLSVVAIWAMPRSFLMSASPSLSIAKPAVSPSFPVAVVTGTPQATVAAPTARPAPPTKAPVSAPTRPPVIPSIRPSSTQPPTNPPTQPPILVTSIRGEATFYCLVAVSPCTIGHLGGLYAAAGAELRAAIGPDWRGHKVMVWYGSHHVTVTLIDTCACDIDLYADAFILLAPLSLGVLDVEVRW